jgi:hypothetical protein
LPDLKSAGCSPIFQILCQLPVKKFVENKLYHRFKKNFQLARALLFLNYKDIILLERDYPRREMGHMWYG